MPMIIGVKFLSRIKRLYVITNQITIPAIAINNIIVNSMYPSIKLLILRNHLQPEFPISIIVPHPDDREREEYIQN